MLISLGTSECTSTKKSISDGAISELSLGAASGAFIASRKKGEVALTTGAIGALSSYFIHREFEKESEKVRRKALLNLEQYGFRGDFNGESKPVVTPPIIEQYDIEAKIQGKNLIGPHKVWKIKEGVRRQLEQRGQKQETGINLSKREKIDA